MRAGNVTANYKIPSSRFGNPILLPRMLALSTCECSSRCDDSSVEVSLKKFRKSLQAMIELLSLWR